MSEVVIQKVRLDPNGRLRVQPAKPAVYPHIYRSASSVRWDSDNSELYVLAILVFDAVAELKQITLAVAQEYGDELLLSSFTEYVDVPGDLVATLVRSVA